MLLLDSYTYEKFICQDTRDSITCYGGRKIKITRAYYGRMQMFKCGFGLNTNCKSDGSEAMVILFQCDPTFHNTSVLGARTAMQREWINPLFRLRRLKTFPLFFSTYYKETVLCHLFCKTTLAFSSNFNCN